LLAPRWTSAGYKGRLKNAVTEFIESINEEEEGNEKEEEGVKQSQPDSDRYDADIGEHVIEEEEKNEKEEEGVKEVNEEMEDVVETTVLLTSNDQHIVENSDSEFLEMDD
jgi:hypothetical protein